MELPELKTAAERLLWALRSRSMTQKHLAGLLGVGQESVSRWVCGRESVPKHRLMQASAHLDVPVEWLTGREIAEALTPAKRERIARQRLGCPYHSEAEIGALYGVSAGTVLECVETYQRERST